MPALSFRARRAISSARLSFRARSAIQMRSESRDPAFCVSRVLFGANLRQFLSS